jgi:hypothetical protein
MSMFEKATRLKLRFASNKGDLTVENLWELPLQSRTGFDLDNVAKAANNELKSLSEESFVSTTNNPAKNLAQLKLDIVKRVIEVKIAENEEQRNAAQKSAERQRLLEALNNSEQQELQKLTPDEIRKRLAELG